MAQGGDRHARIADLVWSAQVRQRQIEQAGFILKDHPTVFFPCVPVLAMGQKGAPSSLGVGLDHRKRLVMLGADDAGHAALDDPGLFAGDFGHRFAKELLMIQIDRGDDRQARACR